MKPHIWLLWIGLLTCGIVPADAEDEFDRPPILYRRSKPTDRVARWHAEQLRVGRELPFNILHGYLPGLLRALDIPVSSQTLVFSKTSLQRQRIGPETPRALYFNDDVYVGYTFRGEMLEISAADPQLGAVFYTFSQIHDPPELKRQTDQCLLCHGGSQTRDIPGHIIRSVYPDASGQPITGLGSFRIDHTSPLAERWGGWYVTGTHGAQRHLGNLIVTDREPGRPVENPAGWDRTDLSDRFNTAQFLTPHSDIVALMVLEHQVEGHNRIARAQFAARQAAHYEQELNRALNEPADHRWPSAAARMKSAAEELVQYLLLSGEAPLTDAIRGTSTFAEDFTRRGPADPQGRSLRQFDLERRLFRYPCSYLIYSEAFAALPEPMLQLVWQRLDDVLSGRETSKPYAHLTADDRQAIREILRATLPAAAKSWNGSKPAEP